jgi:hypothetical protein
MSGGVARTLPALNTPAIEVKMTLLHVALAALLLSTIQAHAQVNGQRDTPGTEQPGTNATALPGVPADSKAMKPTPTTPPALRPTPTPLTTAPIPAPRTSGSAPVVK